MSVPQGRRLIDKFDQHAGEVRPLRPGQELTSSVRAPDSGLDPNLQPQEFSGQSFSVRFMPVDGDEIRLLGPGAGAPQLPFSIGLNPVPTRDSDRDAGAGLAYRSESFSNGASRQSFFSLGVTRMQVEGKRTRFHRVAGSMGELLGCDRHSGVLHDCTVAVQGRFETHARRLAASGLKAARMET